MNTIDQITRLKKLKKILEAENRFKTKWLADRFKVCKQTVLNDIKVLESFGCKFDISYGGIKGLNLTEIEF